MVDASTFVPVTVLLCLFFGEAQQFTFNTYHMIPQYNDEFPLASEMVFANRSCNFVVFNSGSSILEAKAEGEDEPEKETFVSSSVFVGPRSTGDVALDFEKSGDFRCRLLIRNLDTSKITEFFTAEKQTYANLSRTEFAQMLTQKMWETDVPNYSRGEEELMKNILLSELSQSPVRMGPSLGFVVDLFWPYNQTSIWDELRMNMKWTMDPETARKSYSLIDAKLIVVKERMINILSKLNSTAPMDIRTSVSSDFMALAFMLYSMEDEIAAELWDRPEAMLMNFELDKEFSVTTLPLLPLYSVFVTLAMLFNAVGLSSDCGSHRKLVLNSLEKNLLVQFESQMFNRSKTVITNLKAEIIDQVKKLPRKLVFRRLVDHKNYFAYHGHEFVTIWESIIYHRTAKRSKSVIRGPDFTDATMFSEPLYVSIFMTPGMFDYLPKASPECLVPQYEVKGTRKRRPNKLVTICVNLRLNNTSIVGLKLGYRDGKVYEVGGYEYTNSSCFHLADNSVYLSSVRIEGFTDEHGQITRMKFRLSNGDVHDFHDYDDYGDAKMAFVRDFSARKGYQIVGMYGTPYNRVKLSNIQFSYQRVVDNLTSPVDEENMRRSIPKWGSNCW